MGKKMREITVQTPSVKFRPTFIRFLYIFIPALIVLLLLAAVYYRGKITASMAELSSNEMNAVNLQSYVVERNFRDVLSDLMFLETHREFVNYLSKPDMITKTALIEEWKNLAMSKGVYDSIKLVDRNGHEIVRVEYDNGVAFSVRDEKLKNVSKDESFSGAISMRSGEIFVSSFHLDKEGGEIVTPYKPLITFATPIFNADGELGGALILNFLGKTLIDDIKRSSTSSGMSMLIDSQGYWIVGPTPEDEWGFAVPDRMDSKFSLSFPQAWQAMSVSSSGQINVDSGLFTYTTIFPLMEGKRTSSGPARGRYFDTGLIRGKAYSWKLMSFVDKQAVSAHSGALLKALIPLFIGLIAIAGVLGALLAIASEKAVVAEGAFKFQVSHDRLTGIWNRTGILELLRREIARARRDGSFLSVALADIDGFNKINMELGEAEADEVLRAVSRAICDSIREYDSAGRYAADQFLIVLPNCDKNDALLVLDRINAGLEALGEIGFPAQADIKVSIGLSGAKMKGDISADNLIRDAINDMREARNARGSD